MTQPLFSPHIRRGCLLLACILTLAGCTHYGTVSSKRPEYHPEEEAAGPLIKAQQHLEEGRRRQRSRPMIALADYLTAAEICAQILQKNPDDGVALHCYNFAVARVVSTVRDAKLALGDKALKIPADGGDYLLSGRRDRHRAWDAGVHVFTPADEFEVGGEYVQQHTTKGGLGAPLVAVGYHHEAAARARFLAERSYYGVTAIARFGPGRSCLLALEDPLQTEHVDFGGHRYPLAADFTVPLAVMLAAEKPERMELARVFFPEKYAETAHIVRLEPYDPKKTVVVVVHGLADSQATWAPMLNTLWGDPVIRRNFQFWYYSYPSGYPYPYSAAIMRRELDAAEKRFPSRKPMVLIGHSMGSLISRLMITDSGDKIWSSFFGRPPDKMRLSKRSRRVLTESLIFKRRPDIGRVVFIAAPHRGSDIAQGFIGRLASFLVRTPSTLLHVAQDVKDFVRSDSSLLKANRIPSSLDTLSPKSQFVKLLSAIPIAAGIPYHSIMGDRGRGDSPNSSDGVVPYASARIAGALSELIVPSGHSAHQDPKAIAEVGRILRLHTAQTGARKPSRAAFTPAQKD
jgi:pimeloyl-ACP methyl ester carboxylesterase